MQEALELTGPCAVDLGQREGDERDSSGNRDIRCRVLQSEKAHQVVQQQEAEKRTDIGGVALVLRSHRGIHHVADEGHEPLAAA